MDRYLLDTNILIFMIIGEYGDISSTTKNIFDDFPDLRTSSLCALELLQLFRIGKIKSNKYKTTDKIITALEKEFYIKIESFGEQHIETLTKLNIPEDHNDPFDHAIIAHAISEKLTLISSDTQFEHYTKQKLKFVFNER
jgi:PIN domain nuclease of toxin-antitoxin system